jgi:hypothetical protein
VVKLHRLVHSEALLETRVIALVIELMEVVPFPVGVDAAHDLTLAGFEVDGHGLEEP